MQLSSSDENSYLQQIIDDLQSKCDMPPYADRRATAMLSSHDDDYEIENELQFSMDEITQNEQTLK